MMAPFALILLLMSPVQAAQFVPVDDIPGIVPPDVDLPDPLPTPTRLNNSCRYAFDGECDEPRYCAVGTDTFDCR